MKSVYESILSNTKTGSEFIAEKIKKWVSSIFNFVDARDLAGIKTELHNKNFFVIIQKYNYIGERIELDQKKYESIPKELNGFYNTKYNDTGLRSICVSNLIFSDFNNYNIDLSRFNMSAVKYAANKKMPYIDFHGLKKCEIKGLPEYMGDFICRLSGGIENKLNGVKSKKCKMYIHHDKTNIDDIKNCSLKELYFGKNNTEKDFVNLKESENQVLSFTPEAEKTIDKLKKNNTIKNIFFIFNGLYQPNKTLSSGIYTVEKYLDGRYKGVLKEII